MTRPSGEDTLIPQAKSARLTELHSEDNLCPPGEPGTTHAWIQEHPPAGAGLPAAKAKSGTRGREARGGTEHSEFLSLC